MKQQDNQPKEPRTPKLHPPIKREHNLVVDYAGPGHAGVVASASCCTLDNMGVR
jgi:hypothetical protein